MYVELVKKVHAFKTTDTGDLVNTNQTEGWNGPPSIFCFITF